MTGALIFCTIEMAASCLVSVYEELMKRKLNSEEHKDVNKFGVPIIQLKDIKYLLIKYKKNLLGLVETTSL